MKAVEALLSGCIDFAGMFPPARLELATTVREYCRYHAGGDAWALGSLIVPAGSLAGFRALLPSSAADWHTSLLLGPEWENDLRLAQQLGLSFHVCEFKPSHPVQVEQVRRLLPPSTEIFFEVPAGGELPEFLAAIADTKSYAKIRTGGLTADAIPPVEQVLDFLCRCAERHIPFKATAGLHHVIRSFHPLTSAADSEKALMHGFLNVVLAASLLYRGGDPQEAAALLDDGSPASFRFEADRICWRDCSFTVPVLSDVRRSFMLSFGSCSFTEPLTELRQMRWL